MIGFADIAKEFLLLVSGHLDEYTDDNGFVQIESETRVTLFTPAHIQFAKYGRGPGKNPPLDNMLAFVKKEGIIFDNTDERGTAFAIQASISKKGTKNWVPNAPNAMEEAISTEFEKYSKAVSKLFRVSVNDEVQEIYKDIFPEKVEVKI